MNRDKYRLGVLAASRYRRGPQKKLTVLGMQITMTYWYDTEKHVDFIEEDSPFG